MRTMKTNLFTAIVKTPYGLYSVACETMEGDARRDIYTAAVSEFRCHIGLLRVEAISQSTRHCLRKMQPIKNCVSSGKQWGWVQKL